MLQTFTWTLSSWNWTVDSNRTTRTQIDVLCDLVEPNEFSSVLKIQLQFAFSAHKKHFISKLQLTWGKRTRIPEQKHRQTITHDFMIRENEHILTKFYTFNQCDAFEGQPRTGQKNGSDPLILLIKSIQKSNHENQEVNTHSSQTKLK